MKSSAVHRPVFRTPLAILAILNLAVIGVRLWPWSTAGQLTGDSDTILDPVITLGAYVILAFWIGSTRGERQRRSLLHAATLGVVAGLVLVGLVALASVPVPDGGSQHHKAQLGFVAVALLLWAAAAMRARRLGAAVAFASVCAAWSAMVSALVACTALLVETCSSAGPDQMPDPWKQLQQQLIGPDSTQPVAHALNAATAFLLLAPLAACVAGAVLSSFLRPRTAQTADR